MKQSRCSSKIHGSQMHRYGNIDINFSFVFPCTLWIFLLLYLYLMMSLIEKLEKVNQRITYQGYILCLLSDIILCLCVLWVWRVCESLPCSNQLIENMQIMWPLVTRVRNVCSYQATEYCHFLIKFLCHMYTHRHLQRSNHILLWGNHWYLVVSGQSLCKVNT